MHRDKKKEIVEAISETFPEFLTRVWGPDGPSNTALMTLGILAKRKGYKRLLIAITDADSGETITRRQTFQKPDDISSFIDTLIELAVPPDELLEGTPFLFTGPDGNEEFSAPTEKILNKQIIGGRSKTGISEETAKRYRALVDLYNGSDLPQEEFCIEMRISRSKLTRALKFVSKNR